MDTVSRTTLNNLIRSLNSNPYVHPTQIGLYLVSILRRIQQLEETLPEANYRPCPTRINPDQSIQDIKPCTAEIIQLRAKDFMDKG